MNFKKLNPHIFLFSFLFLLAGVFFTSCREDKYPFVENLFESLEWTYATADDTVENLIENFDTYDFKPFVCEESKGQNNLSNLVGADGTFIWVKGDFKVPEQYRGRDMAMYSTRLNMAFEVYLNGNFIGKSGRFPPHELGTEKMPHFFTFSRNLVNAEENNQILIKIWVHGNCGLGSKFLVGEYDEVRDIYDISYYVLVSMYTVFEGGFLILFILYLLLYFGQRDKKEYLYFALLNAYSSQFSLMFFLPLFPAYQNSVTPYLYSVKYYGCFCLFVLIYLFCCFSESYLKVKFPKWIIWARRVLFVTQNVIMFSAKDLNVLRVMSRKLFIFSFLIWLPIGVVFTKLLIKHKNLTEQEKRAKYLMIGLAPFLLCGIADIIIKEGFCNINIPYLVYYGWVATMICYLLVLSISYSRALRANEYLNRNLQKEVEVRTQEIKIANERLEDELFRQHQDLEMAAIVQKRTFQNQLNNFIGWDIAVSYDPLSEVSGDLYDFYNVGKILDGFSLFDVSGHGIAASLITMLSKSLIYNCYKKSRQEVIKSSKIMEDINNSIIDAKGNAENYMTGLLFQISEFDITDASCVLQFANAGHPHPILYTCSEKKASHLLSANAVNQYGAIGFKDIEVSFQDVSIKMCVGDILVCFTDGLIESVNAENVQFGKENVLKVVEQHHEETAESILEAIKAELDAFIKEKEVNDDMTILVLKRQHPDDFLEEI